MKIFCILSLVLMIHTAQADSLGDEVAALKIKFPEGRKLSSNELRQVLQLAHRGGIERVVEIQPQKGYSGAQGLKLKAKEVVKDRRGSQISLNIWPKKWHPDLSRPHPNASTNGLGGFFLDKGGTYEYQWATFTIKGHTVRLHCSRDTTDLAEADKALDALLKGRIDFQNDEAKTQFKEVNTSLLDSIFINGKAVMIGFGTGDPLCGSSIHGELKGDRLIIGRVMHICA